MGSDMSDFWGRIFKEKYGFFTIKYHIDIHYKKAFSLQDLPEDEDAFLVVVCGSANSWIWIIDNKIRYENN